MITFVAALAALILGYILYGAFVERVFGADPARKTPCYTHGDGVDYIPMPTWKVYLIQFLNIAGTGPIFGSIMGILFGPAAYLWIVFGSIFGGAVHDYLSGMISIRKDGMSLPEIVGDELGSGVRQAMRLFSLVLMVLVGTVFVTTPAGLLATMTVGWGPFGSVAFWSVVIFIYYILATLLPIDALIGRIYPVFGVALLIMAVGVLVGIFTHTGWMPEITEAFTNHHPNHSLPIFPMLFITIACGAVSGFHATQRPHDGTLHKERAHGPPRILRRHDHRGHRSDDMGRRSDKVCRRLRRAAADAHRRGQLEPRPCRQLHLQRLDGRHRGHSRHPRCRGRPPSPRATRPSAARAS